MEFAVRYLPQGAESVLEERLEGPDAPAVRLRLQESGSVVLSVKPVSAAAPPRWALRSEFDVAWWCKEMETLLRAGMTVVEAIDTLAASDEGGPRGQIHRELMTRLRAGSALSSALREAGAFPDVLVAGVAASERSSRLPDALAQYQAYHQALSALKRQATSAAMYPAMVVGVGVLVSVFLLLYVIPRFSRMYGGMTQQLSPATEFVLALSTLLRDHGLWVMVALVAGAASVWLGWRAWPAARTTGAALLERFGPLSRLWSQFRLAQLYQALALLMRGGYNLDEALAIATGMKLGARLADSLDIARAHIASGRAASAAFADASLTDETSRRLLAVGERSGAFDQVLEAVAQRHAQRFGTGVERLTRIVEPVLLLVVAVFVGALVVMMYMPIFDIAGGLGGSR